MTIALQTCVWLCLRVEGKGGGGGGGERRRRQRYMYIFPYHARCPGALGKSGLTRILMEVGCGRL